MLRLPNLSRCQPHPVSSPHAFTLSQTTLCWPCHLTQTVQDRFYWRDSGGDSFHHYTDHLGYQLVQRFFNQAGLFSFASTVLQCQSIVNDHLSVCKWGPIDFLLMVHKTVCCTIMQVSLCGLALTNDRYSLKLGQHDLHFSFDKIRMTFASKFMEMLQFDLALF